MTSLAGTDHESGLAAWRQVAQDRLRNAPRRCFYAILGAATTALLFKAPIALFWAAAIAAVCFVDLRVWRRYAEAPPRVMTLLLAWVYCQTALFCLLAPILWFSPLPEGKVIAAFYLAAAALNLLATMHPRRDVLAAGLAGAFSVLVVLPLVDYAQTAPAFEHERLLTLLGVGFLAAYCMTIWRGLANTDAQRRAEEAAARARGEAAEATARAKTDLLALVSRELRTPVAAVLDASQAIDARTLGPADQRRLKTLREAGDVLTTVMGDLSTLAALGAGRISATPEPTDPSELLEAVGRAWRDQAEGRWLELFVDAAPEASTRVMLDPVRVRQILYHLVANALTHTAQGGVRLRAQVAPAPGENEIRLAFTVADTGAGIAPGRLEDLLGRPGEDRLAAAAARGDGLGLAIVATIAERIGARLTARSVVGQGSAFTLSMTAPLAPNAAAEPSGAEIATGDLRVLVVDDSAAHRRLATVFLTPAVRSVTAVASGAEALEALEAGGFDIVLMDLQMAPMDGCAATRAIRESGRPYALVPIVAVTARTDEASRERAAACGMDGFLAKPITPANLLAGINAALTAHTEPPEMRPGDARLSV